MPEILTKHTDEQIQFMLDNPIVSMPDSEALAEDSKLPLAKRRYEEWRCRYSSYECIIRHRRRTKDPLTDQITQTPGRRVRFKNGVAFVWKDDPEYKMIVGVMRRRPDFKVGNLMCEWDRKMKNADVDDIEPEFLGQKESIPLQKLGIHPSRMGAVQKILNRQASQREAVMKDRIKGLEAELSAAKAGGKPAKEIKANGGSDL